MAYFVKYFNERRTYIKNVANVKTANNQHFDFD